MRKIVAALLALLLVPASAHAHGLTGRADLPVPLETFYVAAAVALVVSFVVLGAGWRTPLLTGDRWRAMPHLTRVLLHPVVLGLARAWVLVLYGAVVVSPFLAPDEAAATDVLAPVYVFVLFWVVIPAVSAVFGDLWRGLHPIATLGRLLRLPSTTERPAPPRGIWLANLGILAFVWLELVYPLATNLTAFGWLLLAYTALTLVSMHHWGIERWLDQGDPFTIYTRTFAALSAFETRKSGTAGRPMLGLRRPILDARRLATPPGTVALMGLLIGSVSYDGFSATAWFEARLTGWRATMIEAGMDVEAWTLVVRSVWLFGFVAAAAGLFALMGEWSGRIGKLRPTGGSHATAFAHTLVPIALAYLVAHYFSYAVFQGQLGWILLSDPFAQGWNLLGAAGGRIDYGLLGAETIWYVQVGAIVVGHVVALAVAHDRALQLAPSTGRALRSQVPMLMLMLTYTLAGMWFLSEGLG